MLLQQLQSLPGIISWHLQQQQRQQKQQWNSKPELYTRAACGMQQPEGQEHTTNNH
jgi:hypothetical protein